MTGKKQGRASNAGCTTATSRSRQTTSPSVARNTSTSGSAKRATTTNLPSGGNWQSVSEFVKTAMRYELGVACVDLDSVLLKHNPQDGTSRLGPVLPLGRKLVKLLKARKYRVVVLTSRPLVGMRWLKILAYLQNRDVPVYHVTNLKPPADVYFDDKAYRVEKNWQ